jgi:hypothetical protein
LKPLQVERSAWRASISVISTHGSPGPAKGVFDHGVSVVRRMAEVDDHLAILLMIR